MAVKVPPGQREVKVNLSAAPLKESGISVTIDVNSQPSKTKRNPISDLEDVLSQHEAAFATLRTDLNLADLI
jgi:hypothetical protein